MSEAATNASNPLSQAKDRVTSGKTVATIPFDPDWTELPSRKNVPQIEGALAGAAWVWGKGDNVSESVKWYALALNQYRLAV